MTDTGINYWLGRIEEEIENEDAFESRDAIGKLREAVEESDHHHMSAELDDALKRLNRDAYWDEDWEKAARRLKAVRSLLGQSGEKDPFASLIDGIARVLEPESVRREREEREERKRREREEHAARIRREREEAAAAAAELLVEGFSALFRGVKNGVRGAAAYVKRS